MVKKVEFELPEPEDTEEIIVEPARNRTERVLEMEQRELNLNKDDDEEEPESKKPEPEKKAKKPESGEADIEIIDDTPEEDRGRQPSEPAQEPTEEELEGYSDRVKKRVKHLTKTMHDQRRRGDSAERERDEAIQFARSVLAENEKLKQNTSRSKNSLIAQAKKTAASEVEAAQRAYKEAYESGDADKVVEAQTKLSEAVAKKSRIDSWRPEALQPEKDTVQRQGQHAAPTSQQPRQPDPKLQAWMEENPWFGSDDEMTGYAYGVHNRLKREGVKGSDDDYYEKLTAAVKKRFPEEFEEDSDDDEPPKKEVKKDSDPVVAPVSRSHAPKKMKLTATQVAIAKELGVPLERYAKQAALLESKENG